MSQTEPLELYDEPPWHQEEPSWLHGETPWLQCEPLLLYCEPPPQLQGKPCDDSTHMVSCDNWSAVCLVLLTVGPSPNPKVDKLFISIQKTNICTPKSWTNCHNVTVVPA
jgi:hypothetical protein